MSLVLDHLSNTYIIPCDIWCDRNPFHKNELYSWYMVSDLIDDDSTVRVNRKNELVTVQDGVGGNAMIGICYLEEEDAACVWRNHYDAANRRVEITVDIDYHETGEHFHEQFCEYTYDLDTIRTALEKHGFALESVD